MNLGFTDLRTAARHHRHELCSAFVEAVSGDTHWPTDVPQTTEGLLNALDQALSPESPAFQIWTVLSSGETPCVVGGILFESDAQSACCLIKYLFVRPEHRRNGIASRLLSDVAEAIRTQGAHRDGVTLFIETPDPLSVARISETRHAVYEVLAVWQALGFRRVTTGLGVVDDISATRLLLCRVMDSNADWDEAVQQCAHTMQRRGLGWLRQLTAETEPEIEPISHLIPAPYDRILGFADGLSVRLIYFGGSGGEPRTGAPSVAGTLRKFLDDEAKAKEKARATAPSSPTQRSLKNYLSDPVHSFHSDIVGTFFATDEKLPLVLQCEPFREELVPGADFTQPHRLTISIKPEIKARWEDHESILRFSDDTGPYEIVVNMVDSVAFFEDGQVAYCISMIMEPREGHRIPVETPTLLALETLVAPAGPVEDEEGSIRLALSGSGNEPLPARAFFRSRLAHLSAAGNWHSHDRQQESSTPTVFTVLAGASAGEASADLAVRKLRSLFDNEDEQNVSIGIEVIGADQLERIRRNAEAAKQREAPVTAFSKRLAGIVQNVMDFEEQDLEEINDSLSFYGKIGNEMDFASKNIIIRFSEHSRPYQQKRSELGGSPYWMLVQLVLGYNDSLLRPRLLDHETRWREVMNPYFVQSASRRQAGRQLNRTRMEQARLASYIPNVFRYPTERMLYEFASGAWDLSGQQKMLIDNEQLLEGVARERAERLREETDGRMTRALLAISFLQVAGIFVALTAITHEEVERFLSDGLQTSDFYLWPLWALVIAVPIFVVVVLWLLFAGIRWRIISRIGPILRWPLRFGKAR